MITPERLLAWLALAALAGGCALILAPFVSAILWAGILTYTTWPAFTALRRVGLPRVAASLALVLSAAVLVVVPLALAVPDRRDALDLQASVAAAVAAGLPVAPSWVSALPLVGGRIAHAWDAWAADITASFSFFQPFAGELAGAVLRLLLGLAHGVIDFVFALVVAFFLYLHGAGVGRMLAAISHRMAGPRGEALVELAGRTVRGVVVGILGTALVQGLLVALGLWIFGVPRAALLGVVAGGVAVLPVGAPLVWIPASLWLLGEGRTLAGVGLLIYGVVLVTGADSLMRPFFIARGAALPYLLTLLGVLGGAVAFGLLGVFLGPVLLGVAFTLLRQWTAPDAATGDGTLA